MSATTKTAPDLRTAAWTALHTIQQVQIDDCIPDGFELLRGALDEAERALRTALQQPSQAPADEGEWWEQSSPTPQPAPPAAVATGEQRGDE